MSTTTIPDSLVEHKTILDPLLGSTNTKYGTILEFTDLALIRSKLSKLDTATSSKPKRINSGKHVFSLVPRRINYLLNNHTCVRCGITLSLAMVYKPINTDDKTPNHIHLCGIRDGKIIPLTIDHVLPHSLGGKYADSNFQTLCGHCNTAKGNMMSPSEIALVRADPTKHTRSTVSVDSMLAAVASMENYAQISTDGVSIKKAITEAKIDFISATAAVQGKTPPAVHTRCPVSKVSPDREWIMWWKSRPSVIKLLWYWLNGKSKPRTTPKVAFNNR